MRAVQRRPQIAAHRQPQAAAPQQAPDEAPALDMLPEIGVPASDTPTLDLATQQSANDDPVLYENEDPVMYSNEDPVMYSNEEDPVLYNNGEPAPPNIYTTEASDLSTPAAPAAPTGTAKVAMKAHHGEDQEYFAGGGVWTPQGGLTKQVGQGHVRDEQGKVMVDRRTEYLRTEEERAKYRVGANAEGLLVDHEGNTVDTTAAAAPAAKGTEAGKHIYTLGEDGHMMAMDQRGEQERINQELRGQIGGTQQQRMVHHSTMYAGESVHGAGDVRAKEGWVQEVSNASGHYQGDEASLLDSLQRMDDMGLNLDATRVTEWSQGNATDAGLAGPYVAAGGDRRILDPREEMLEKIRERGETPAAAENDVEAEEEEAPPEEHEDMLQRMREEGSLY